MVHLLHRYHRIDLSMCERKPGSLAIAEVTGCQMWQGLFSMFTLYLHNVENNVIKN